MENYGEGECYICWQPYSDESILGCGHIFCFNCLQRWVQYCLLKPRCPLCNTTFQVQDIMQPNLSFFGDWKFQLRSFFFLLSLIFKKPLWGCIFCCLEYYLIIFWLDWNSDVEEWQKCRPSILSGIFIQFLKCSSRYSPIQVSIHASILSGIFIQFSTNLHKLFRSLIREFLDHGLVGAVSHHWTQFCFNYEFYMCRLMTWGISINISPPFSKAIKSRTRQ